MYVAKKVHQENQQKCNKLINIISKVFWQTCEQISLTELQEIYEDRLLSVRRRTKLAEKLCQEAQSDFHQATEKLWNKARRQKEPSAATATASSQPQAPPAAAAANHSQPQAPQ